MNKIGFIGVGHLASALLTGMLDSREFDVSDIYLYDIDKEKSAKFSKCRVLDSENAIASKCNIIVLSVRPSELKGVLNKIKDSLTGNNILVSTAAGVSTTFIKKQLGMDSKVIRVMPNIPMKIGMGATALSYSMPITYSDLTYIKNLFEVCGIVEILPEEQMNSVISINGSSPAYIFMMIKAMVDYAVSQGIDEKAASRLVMQSIIGTTKLASISEKSINELIREVAVPNGTTIAAISQLEKGFFPKIVEDAMIACTKRANAIEDDIK